MARACTVFALVAVAAAVALSAMSSGVQAAVTVHSGGNAVRHPSMRYPTKKGTPAAGLQKPSHGKGPKNNNAGTTTKKAAPTPRRAELSEAALKSASVPLAEFDTQYALGTKNTSFTFLAACEIPGAPNGQRLLAQWRIAGEFGSNAGVVVSVTGAGGAVTELGSFVLPDQTVTAECVAGVVVFWTDQQLYAVNSTGALVASVAMPQSVAVEGAAIYVATESFSSFNVGTLYGFHVSGAMMFNVSVPCTYAIVAQPAVAPTEVPAALWLGCLDMNGTMHDATTGAAVANTTMLGNSMAYAATPSALVGVAYSQTSYNPAGFGVSWTTGQVMWQSTAISTTNANLFAMKGQDAVVSLTQNDAPVPCNFVVTNARTGATTSSANFTCNGFAGVNFGMVDGAPHLVSVALMNSDTNKLYAIDVTTGATVLNITTPAPACSAFAGCPPLGHLMTLCAATTLVVGQTFPSVDGLFQPTRVATYSYPSGAAIRASERVFANSPLAVTCGGNNGTGYVSIVAPEAVVSVSAVALTPPATATSAPQHQQQQHQAAAPAAVSIHALWNVTQYAFASGRLTAAGTVIAVFNNGFPSVNVSALSGADGATLWNANACNNFPQNPQVAIDEANGLAWVMCQSGTTALNLSTGAVEYVSGPAEQQFGTPVFAPGFVAYTNVSAGGVAAITLRTRAADGSWSIASSVPVAGEQPPASLILKQDAGVVVGFMANGEGEPFSVAATIAAINITTGQMQWAIADGLAVAAMPGNGQISNGPIALIGSTNGVDPEMFGLDAATGAVVWSRSLGQYINLNGAGEGLPFWTACSADGASVYVGTAPAVLKVEVAAGNVTWTLLDTRYFVPLSGTTFDANDGGAVWAAGSSAIVAVNNGAWVVSGASGAKLGSIAAGTMATMASNQAFTTVHGMPNVALTTGVANVSAIAVGQSSAGAALGTVQTGKGFQFNGPYTWAGASATGATSSLVGLQGFTDFTVFSVGAEAPASTTASPATATAQP